MLVSPQPSLSSSSITGTFVSIHTSRHGCLQSHTRLCLAATLCSCPSRRFTMLASIVHYVLAMRHWTQHPSPASHAIKKARHGPHVLSLSHCLTHPFCRHAEERGCIVRRTHRHARLCTHGNTFLMHVDHFAHGVHVPVPRSQHVSVLTLFCTRRRKDRHAQSLQCRCPIIST